MTNSQGSVTAEYFAKYRHRCILMHPITWRHRYWIELRKQWTNYQQLNRND